MTRPFIKTACGIASRLCMLFAVITAIPIVAPIVYGAFQMNLFLEQIPGTCAFALLVPFFSSMGRICMLDTKAERADIAHELNRIAEIFIIMVVAGAAINALCALENGVTSGFAITFGAPGIPYGLVDIGSMDGYALIKIDFFGLILSGFAKAASLAFHDASTDQQVR